MVIPLVLHEPTPVGYGPDEYAMGVNPLTGLQMNDLTKLERRPIVIKVTNYPRSVRPQSGLSYADIVYEYYMERGVTRFIAVYYGQDAEKVGPVRSGRFFDEHIFRMYDAFFVFGSADRRILSHFLAMDSHVVNSLVIESDMDKMQTCSPSLVVPLCRDRDIISYNNMFSNTAALSNLKTRRGAKNDRPDLSGMRFAYRTPPGGEMAFNIYLKYSLFMYNRWAYSVDSGKYIRFQETIGYADPSPELESYAPQIDSLTYQQLGADNVVVLVVPHEYFTKTRSTEIIDIHLVGSGPATIFREGFAFSAIWVRPENGGVLNLLTPDGDHFPLKPGVTWYQVISEETTLERNAVDWRFTFQPPKDPGYPINPEVNSDQ
jgi:hypothetical protein